MFECFPKRTPMIRTRGFQLLGGCIRFESWRGIRRLVFFLPLPSARFVSSLASSVVILALFAVAAYNQLLLAGVAL